ncbi:hypothetical protein [Roseateles sp. LYH14W]|uniref:DUF2934 domain-containing protein n=1 Tax=Pelomonas parva TaxID=3299032 RepID=A0ABW7F144_9BURK
MDNALLWWERASRQGSLEATVYLAHWLSRDKSPLTVQAETGIAAAVALLAAGEQR